MSGDATSDSDHNDPHYPLSEPSNAVSPIPCLDDIEHDTIEPEQIVYIKRRICQFLYREEHGPRLYFDSKARKPIPLHTSEILALMETGDYVVPGGDTPSSDPPAELDEAGRQYLRMAFGS